jgi:hypothetical protein
MKKWTLFAGLILAVVTVSSVAQEKYVKPVDEAAKDPSFLAFRKKLIAAAEKKDWRFIYSIVDPKISTSFGDDSGIAAFKGRWGLEDKDTKFWKEFLPVIKNGGAFTGEGRNRLNYFSAPYTFSSWPDDVDGFEYLAIFGNRVNLREKPSMDGRVISQLSYNVVGIDEEASIRKKTGPGEYDFEYDWYKVKTLGGMEGFVKPEYVRSHIDYRAGFEKKRGVWKMTFFLAGD